MPEEITEQHLTDAGVSQEAVEAGKSLGLGLADILALATKHGPAALAIFEEIRKRRKP